MYVQPREILVKNKSCNEKSHNTCFARGNNSVTCKYFNGLTGLRKIRCKKSNSTTIPKNLIVKTRQCPKLEDFYYKTHMYPKFICVATNSSYLCPFFAGITDKGGIKCQFTEKHKQRPKWT